MTDQRPVSLRDLAFVRDILIPRAWVSGEEVDELVRLRARLDRYFEALRQSPPLSSPTSPVPATPPREPAPSKVAVVPEPAPEVAAT